MTKARGTISLLFVIDGLEFGGGERTFLQLIERLPRNRYNIQVATTPDCEFYNKLSELDITLIPLDFQHRINPQVLKRLLSLIKEDRIDIIHSQGGRVDFYCRVAKRLSRSKVMLINTSTTPVEGYDVSPSRKAIYLFFDRITEKYVDRYIAVSEALRHTLVKRHRIPNERVCKIYNGIELQKFNPDTSLEASENIRKEYGIGQNVFLIGAIGRMVWQKGFEYLLQASRNILNYTGNIKVMLVGDGPLIEKLQKLASHYRIDNHILFTGFRSDIKDILRAVDVLVIPSLAEGFPMITLEAMSMAKPIIATRIDGIIEQITDAKEGILIPSKDSSSLEKAIKKVIEDKEFARSLGIAAREKVEKEFALEKTIIETERVYQSLLI